MLNRLQPDFNGITEIDVPIYEANAYSFYTTYTPLPQWSFTDVASPEPTRTPTYYIDVCPSLTLQDKQLPVEGVIIFSTLSKFMGTYPEDWENHLRGISQRGYNMVHFTPRSAEFQTLLTAYTTSYNSTTPFFPTASRTSHAWSSRCTPSSTCLP
jgi:hypothetical protein